MSEKNSQAPEAPKSNKISSEPNREPVGCPYEGTLTLKDTAKMMFDPNHKMRFLAEYIQLKVRYEKLKYLLTKWEAFGKRFESFNKRPSEELAEFIKWLGFEPSCSFGMLKEQQTQMGELLHTLEMRAVIEGIDLTRVVIKL